MFLAGTALCTVFRFAKVVNFKLANTYIASFYMYEYSFSVVAELMAGPEPFFRGGGGHRLTH